MESNLARPAAACPDASATDRFTAVPDRLLSVLTPREHQLVHALLSFRWFDDSPIVPRVKTLAEKMGGCSPRTVQRAAARLEARGLIVIIPRYRDDTGQTSNEYRPTTVLLSMLPHPRDRDDGDERRTSRPPMTRTSYRSTQRKDQQGTSRNEHQHTARSYQSRDYTATRYGSLSRLRRE